MAQLNHCYPLRSDELYETFEFESEGPSGAILKRIEFSSFSENPIVVNLAFGDLIGDEDLNDTKVANNGDTEKILATVALAVLLFLEYHPDKIVFATGSTYSRNRLYRMAITKYMTGFPEELEISGYVNEEWELFNKNIDYKAFKIEVKTI